jgi:hypothetical protein
MEISSQPYFDIVLKKTNLLELATQLTNSFLDLVSNGTEDDDIIHTLPALLEQIFIAMNYKEKEEFRSRFGKSQSVCLDLMTI